MSIESGLSCVENALEDLETTVNSNNIATNALADAVKDLTGLIKERMKPTTLNVTNAFVERHVTTTEEPEQENFCGFLEGDKVVYVSSIYPRGLEGTVKFHDVRAFRDGEVPVIRGDNNAQDVFPARSTILASALELFQPPEPDPWYKGEPNTDDMNDWNLRMLEAAAESDFYVSFLYQKESNNYLQSKPEAKRVQVARVSKLPPAFSDGEVTVHAVCYDPSVHSPRNFRLDRIKSFIHYSE